MGLFLLHLDDALERQPETLKVTRAKNAHEAHFAEISKHFRLWGNGTVLANFRARLKDEIQAQNDNKPLLTFAGSGDFHHITQLIISCLMEGNDEKITVVHFDNHPDWVHFNDGMHCGSWVNKALEIPNVEKVVTIGVCSEDLKNPEFKGANLANMKAGKIELFPFSHRPSFVLKQYGERPGYSQKGKYITWNNIAEQKEEEFLGTLLKQINTKTIYITVDKDVLDFEDAITNWDQGKMRLPFLLKVLRRLAANFNLLGVDVVGDYSQPKYARGKF